MLSNKYMTTRSLVVFLGTLLGVTAGAIGLVIAASRYDRHTSPYIANDTESTDSCAGTEDPPCPGRVLNVKNPTGRTVVVTVTCSPRTKLVETAKIGPYQRVLFDLHSGAPGGILEGECGITWKYHK